MLQLPKLTWIRFGVWLALGLLIYIFYGIRNSRLGKAAERRKR
jgi:APA family basic amino acid/polyamine antiporter